MENVTLVNNATLYECNQAQCGGVEVCTKNYLLPSGNEEYYTATPQCETLCSKTLCWFACFLASRVCWKSVFLPSVEYRINIYIRWYHSYNNCYILIRRMVSLLSPYRHTHCLPDHILLAVSARQRSRD